MKLAKLLLGATALALLATPILAADYLGGLVKSVMIGDQSVLTDAGGMTLYIFDNDQPGVSNCNDNCAASWPPHLAEAGAMPEGDFTIVERTDGTMMWAYKGMPLYLWARDEKPGDITGDGVGGVWHLALE